LQAVFLAAGMGRRLGDYTKEVTKGMVKVNGKMILEMALDALVSKVDRVIIVTGYQADKLKRYFKNEYKGLKIKYIHNPYYETTNNIYSLWLAADEIEKDDTILLESDIVFEKNLIDLLLEYKSDSGIIAVVSKFQDFMDGTVALLDTCGNITAFVDKEHFQWVYKEKYYKTVNIYKISKEFFKKHYRPFLEAYIKSQGYSAYYEQVLSIITGIKNIKIKALVIDDLKWYEIDTPEDLFIASVLFADEEEKYSMLKKMYGGYWRFPRLKDYCYLVNPYFPTDNFIEEVKNSMKKLITSYPSGRKMIKLLASKVFGVKEDYITVSNGAAELIRYLPEVILGTVGVIYPTFEEYPERFTNIKEFTIESEGFRYNREQVESFLKQVDSIVLINPDNPSGNFINMGDMKDILKYAKELGKIVIVDESFADFADPELRFTLIDNEILEEYENLIVIKSISKSYGVPGIRLGVMATSNKKIIAELEKSLPIWNINSFGEFFLQIISKYSKSYKIACDMIAEERRRFIEELNKIPYIKAYPSQANFVLCKLSGISSTELAVNLIKYDVLIKDCFGKRGISNREYIRLSIRTKNENNILLETLRKCCKGRIKNEVAGSI